MYVNDERNRDTVLHYLKVLVHLSLTSSWSNYDKPKFWFLFPFSLSFWHLKRLLKNRFSSAQYKRCVNLINDWEERMTRTSLDFVWIVSTMLNLNHRLGFHGSTQQMRGPTQYKLNFLCNFERNQTNHFKTKKLTRAKFKQISNQKQHNDNQVFQLFNVW